MGNEAVQDLVGVLPYTLGNDQRRILGDVAKHLHSVDLRVDEPVFFFRVARMGAFDFPSLSRETFREFFFHRLLFGPAFLVGGETEVAVGNEVNGFIFF